MDDGLQSLEAVAILSQDVGQPVPVDGPVPNDAGKGLADGANRRSTRGIEPVHSRIGIPDHGARVRKHGSRGRLAHADRAGEAENNHASRSSACKAIRRTFTSGGSMPNSARNDGRA